MDRYSTYSDEELIRTYRNSPEDASLIDYLMEKYKYLVRNKARAMYLIGGETDDLIQEGMIGLYKAIRNFDEEKEASFQTFARLCIDRQMYQAVESSNRQKHQPLNSYVSLSEEYSEDEIFGDLVARSAEAEVLDQESTRRMEGQIRESLSPFENHVLTSYLRGSSYLQMAEEFEKDSKSIDNAMQRIRVKVRTVVMGDNAKGRDQG